MSVDRSYTLNVTATIKDYEKRLAEVPGVTEKEARKAALALNRELLKGQRLANQAAKRAAQDSANAWKQAGEEALQAAGDASKARGALSLFSAAGGEAAGVLNDLADAGEGLSGVVSALPSLLSPAGLAIGAVTAAVAGGLAYWKLSNKEQETAARRAAEAKAAYQELRPVLDGIAEAELRIAVATGRMTEAQAAEARVRREAAAQFRDSTEGVRERQSELRKELGSTTTAVVDQARAWAKSVGPLGIVGGALLGLARGSEEVNADLAAQQELVTTAAQRVEQWTDAQRMALKVEGQATAEKDRATAASKRLSAAELEEQRIAEGLLRAREAQAAADAFGARLKAIEDSEKRAAAIVSAATRDEADVFAKLEEEKTAKLAEYMEAAKAAAYDRAQIAADTAAIETAYEQRVAEERARLAEEEAERRAAANAAQLSSYGDMLGSLAALAGTVSEANAKHDKRAMLEAWKAQQAFALGQAGLNTALAISNALTTTPAPLAAAAAVAAGLAGAAQVAAIASADPPQLAHQGEVRVGSRPGPMEVDRRLRVDEAVATAQGAELLGRDRIARANRGMNPYADAGAGPGAFTTYQHRTAGRFFRDAVRLSNPLRAAMTTGSTIGLRTRT